MSLPQDQEQEAQNQFQLKSDIVSFFSPKKGSTSRATRTEITKSGYCFIFLPKKGSHRVWGLPAERNLQNQVQDIVIMSMFSKKKVVNEWGGYLQGPQSSAVREIIQVAHIYFYIIEFLQTNDQF